MKRREFITLLGGAAVAWPLAARAQQPDRLRRIAVLMGLFESDPDGQLRVAAYRKELVKLGWTEGTNLRIDIRWAGGSADERHAYATELIDCKPDVMLAGSTTSFAALKQESVIPIVFVQVADPAGDGRIKSFAQPGGNVTGFTSFEYTIGGKWLEILKDLAPNVTRALAILDDQDPSFSGHLRALEAAARSFNVRLTVARSHDVTEIERQITAFADQQNGGLIVLPGPLTAVNRNKIVSLATARRLPAVYPYRYFSESGGLVSYGIDTIDLYRRAARYTDRILRGENPGSLPIQQPIKFELVLNLPAAKALGLTIPPPFLARVDGVIE